MQISSLQKKSLFRGPTPPLRLYQLTKWVKLIDKKEFAKTALDKESETFVVHVAALKALLGLERMTMHPLEAA